LHLAAGTGNVTLNGDIGSSSLPLESLTIDCAGFTAAGSANTIYIANTSVVRVTGNVLAAVDLNMEGVDLIGSGVSIINAGQGLRIKSLKIEAGKSAVLASAPSFPDALSVVGDVELYGTLSAGSGSSVNITVGGNWIQTQSGYDDLAHTGTFDPQNGTVTFTGAVVVIDGVNTNWHRLNFNYSGGTTVKFREYPYPDYRAASPWGHHINGVFDIRNGPGSLITRLSSNDAADAGSLPASALQYDELSNHHAKKFWNLFYNPDENRVFEALRDTKMNWCWVRPTISRDMTLPDTDEWILPYTPASRYNVGWIPLYLIYSFTEDWDHNGKIDHIRVQSSSPLPASLTDPSGGFEARVSGYTVTGYEAHPGAEAYSRYLFYIRLEEKDYADTDQTPSWEIVSNGDLADTFRKDILLDSAKTPIDTAPPQVVYSLALPEGNEIFIRMSEPVEFAAGFNPSASISVNGAAGSYAIEPVTSDPSGKALEFKIINVSPSLLAAADIAGAKNFEFAPLSSGEGHFRDSPASFYYPPRIGTKQLPDCYLLWPDRKYGYGAVSNGYEDKAPSWSGSLVEMKMPNYNWKNGSDLSPAYDYVHRLSDLLLAPPQTSAADPFFALPVYAHDLTGAGNTDLRIRIFEFDGSRELMDMEVTVQAKLSEAAASGGVRALSLRYAADQRIPAEFRSRRELHGIEGLWLPDSAGNPAAAMVPRPYREAGNSPGDPGPGNNLYNFTIPGSDLKNHSSVEFYFTAHGPADLIVARLDSRNSASLPWYRRVKPFSFRLREMTSQRGGATVLNNVINPDRGDSAVIHYLLTRSGRMSIQVFTLDGNLVKVLERSSRSAGEHTVSWDGRNTGGRAVARGLYFIRIVGPDIDEIRKVMVVK
ncbi:MAG: hypothetical protein LBH26_04375, partial [Treponema sp.]|nr:hypothetical protein [Treponema sp.]